MSVKFQDYYETLGVEPGAGEAEIKTAYRRLARKYHPDVSKEAGAEEKLKAVNEAYEALRDPQKRAAYDQLRAGAIAPATKFRLPVDLVAAMAVPAAATRILITRKSSRAAVPVAVSVISSSKCSGAVADARAAHRGLVAMVTAGRS